MLRTLTVDIGKEYAHHQGFSLEGLTKRYLAKIVDKLNNRRRKALGYRTTSSSWIGGSG